MGIGIDIIEVPRIEKQLGSGAESFIRRVFSDSEVSYCESKLKNKAQNYAVRFAAKEAFFKAIGTGWRKGLSWRDVAMTNDELGKPSIVVSGQAQKIIDALHVSKIHVSVSHLNQMAVAIIILEQESLCHTSDLTKNV
ncbi:MAG: holo-ACP synthase [candidate division KSB1 bacterium]|nr:holo-ACP synthase [candidate division KSB1 bacterium]MDZ7340128.1 holo-ACP synthase [candidate division KSB1 bacterium]